MKAVILAGGRGTRLSEETHAKPKPLVTIGGRPIIWHIMKHLSFHGIHDFVIALGYRGNDIKRFFMDDLNLQGDMTVDYGSREIHTSSESIPHEPWSIQLVETGLDTNTGGRLLRLKEILGDEAFLLTYGDGVSSVDISALQAYHAESNQAATLTAVRPPARFGGLEFNEGTIKSFTEKSQVGEGWINGGFMIMDPAIFDYLQSDEDSLEFHALEALADAGGLGAYKHDGFWQCMDTVRDRDLLERLWAQENAPWKVW